MHTKSKQTPVICCFFLAMLAHPAMAISPSLSHVPFNGGTLFGHVGEAKFSLIARVAAAQGTETKAPVPGPAVVPSETDPATRGQKGMSERATPDEVQELKERIIELQNKSKLRFRKTVACSSVEGFGAYSPIETGQKVDKLVIYCEPANVSTLKSGDRYVIDCSVDFMLMDSSGKVLGGRESALRINRVTRSPVMDLYFKVEMRLRKFLDQSVFIKTVLHDKIKNETISVINKINVEAGAKKHDGI